MYGIDYLGGAKYGKVILDEHPQGWAAGFFSNTFGDCLPVVSSLVRTGRCPRIRLHLMWKDDHRFSESDIPAIVKEAKRVLPVVKANPQIEWRISPCCEHNLPYGTIRKIFDAIVPVFGTLVVYVNSPMGGALEPTCVNEFHGNKAQPKGQRVDFSFDGNTAFDCDVEALKARFSSAETFYFWYAGCNGKLNDADKTPRPQREAYPTSKYIDSLIYLHNGCGSVNIPSDWILKSHSDRHETPPEARAGHPLIIAPASAGNVITFKAMNSSQVIATCRKSDKYNEKRPGKPPRYIYRVNDDWGYLLSEKAKRISDDTRVEIYCGNKKVGICNLAFRGGSFR